MSGHIALGLCFLVTALLCIQADTDVLCKSGTKDYTVDLPSNTTYKFGTAYRRYKARQRCTATYTLTTCEQASISCSSFSTIGFRGCTRGDYLLIKDSMGNKRFCNTNKPIEYKPTGDFSIQFVSDAKRASTGLKCTVTCDSPSALSVVSTKGECGDTCKSEGGECAWDQPAGNFSAIGKCSEGVYGEGTYCQCGTCWKKNEIDPCEDSKCKESGGICSWDQPRPDYESTGKCGVTGFIGPDPDGNPGTICYCGYCWKPKVVECRNLMCEEGMGICSPVSPGWGWRKHGNCGDTLDCVCWIYTLGLRNLDTAL